MKVFSVLMAIAFLFTGAKATHELKVMKPVPVVLAVPVSSYDSISEKLEVVSSSFNTASDKQKALLVGVREKR